MAKGRPTLSLFYDTKCAVRSHRLGTAGQRYHSESHLRLRSQIVTLKEAHGKSLWGQRHLTQFNQQLKASAF